MVETIGTIANIAGSIGGLFGKKKSNPQKAIDLQEQSADRMARNMPSAQVAGWKAAGINPLFGLSSGSGQYSLPSIIGDDFGDSSLGSKIQEMGNGIGRAAEAYAGKEERDLNRRLLDTQLKGAELDNIKKASEIRLMNQAGQPAGLPIGVDGSIQAGDTLERFNVFDNDILTRPPKPVMKIGVTPEGIPIRIWDDEVGGDSELGSASSFVRFTIPDYLKGNLIKGRDWLSRQESFPELIKRKFKTDKDFWGR